MAPHSRRKHSENKIYFSIKNSKFYFCEWIIVWVELVGEKQVRKQKWIIHEFVELMND